MNATEDDEILWLYCDGVDFITNDKGDITNEKEGITVHFDELETIAAIYAKICSDNKKLPSDLYMGV